jgi:hypothetical protein
MLNGIELKKGGRKISALFVSLSFPLLLRWGLQ